MNVTVATCHQLPHPDADAALLEAALRAQGMTPTSRGWDDPAADFATDPLCVVRSTWNYHHRVSEFIDWAARTARVTQLCNPAEVIAWNAHKRYLRDLAEQGLPVVPTAWLARGATTSLADLLAAHGWEQAVVKPAVSAGSFATERVSARDVAAGEAHLRRLVRERDAMVQPYVRSVEGHGERALVWIDGEFTHAIRKSPRFGDDPERVSEALAVLPEERAVAERVLAAAPGPLLYARVDLARDEQGEPMVMELELIEPSLFLRAAPHALARFAAAIAARARAA